MRIYLTVRSVYMVKVLDEMAYLFDIKVCRKNFMYKHLRAYKAENWLSFLGFLMFLQQYTWRDVGGESTGVNFFTNQGSRLLKRSANVKSNFLALLREERVRLPRKYGSRFLRKKILRNPKIMRDSVFANNFLFYKSTVQRNLKIIMISVNQQNLPWEFFKQNYLNVSWGKILGYIYMLQLMSFKYRLESFFFSKYIFNTYFVFGWHDPKVNTNF